MTRNYEIDCRDLTECDHKPLILVVEEGESIYWICACGRRVPEKTRNGKKKEK